MKINTIAQMEKDFQAYLELNPELTDSSNIQIDGLDEIDRTLSDIQSLPESFELVD